MSWHRFKEAVRDGVNPQVAAQESVVWKKGGSAPDYRPMAQASKEAAQIMAGLGEKQLAFAKSQYAENAPLMRQIANQQMAAQQQQMQQAQDYYNYQQQTFRPLEKSIVADAQNFNTDAYRQSQAQKAAAEAGRAQAVTQQANLRAAASMGLNPNSGRFAGMNASSNLGLAAQRAAAMTGARQSAEQMGYARKLDAAGLGRNLAGASTAAYGGATAAGNAAGGNYQSAGQNYLGNMGQAANTYNAGFQNQITGLGNILNNQTKMAITDNKLLADGLGTVAGFAMASDRRLKHDIKLVGVDQRTALNLYEFRYNDQPEKRWVGVMADEVKLVYPDAVLTKPDGYMMVDYGALGIQMQEVA